MKKMLMLASVASMIDQFNISNIVILQKLGYKVDVACNFEKGNPCSDDKIDMLKQKLEQMGVNYYQIDFTRNVLNLQQDWRAYKQVKKLVTDNVYSFIHCHSPIGGVIGRMVAHKTHTKVVYTAHGFHFFKGAPKLNWLIYYPIEKFFSRFTDILITINTEDYERAKKKFHAHKVEYIPGVGVNTERFRTCGKDKTEKRRELGIPEDDFVLLSVGELRDIKNQRVIIEALHKLKKKDIFYLVVGKGELQTEYEKLIEQYDLKDNIRLLGFRTDISELCRAADCFVHPSLREGLGIAPLEAMSSGLPLISSCIHGIKDYAMDGVSGYCVRNPLSGDEMAEAISKMYLSKSFRDVCGKNNATVARKFDISNTEEKMNQIYMNI